ncbi:hypothetical protein [Streptomyces sp. Ac-502]|uniref:hypothetical protein n=1 Tax=Streptomyces sp. Ac-502 TaxID=3342801 RepID=UPI003862AFB8
MTDRTQASADADTQPKSPEPPCNQCGNAGGYAETSYPTPGVQSNVFMPCPAPTCSGRG